MFKKKEPNLSDDVKQGLLQKVKPIIARELDINEDKIFLESKLKEDLGADSLDSIQIVMALEEEFNIEIADEDIDKIRAVDDIIIYLAKRITPP